MLKFYKEPMIACWNETFKTNNYAESLFKEL